MISPMLGSSPPRTQLLWIALKGRGGDGKAEGRVGWGWGDTNKLKQSAKWVSKGGREGIHIIPSVTPTLVKSTVGKLGQILEEVMFCRYKIHRKQAECGWNAITVYNTQYGDFKFSNYILHSLHHHTFVRNKTLQYCTAPHPTLLFSNI